MNVKSQRRGKWNIVDVLIVLLVVLAIMVLGYMMFFSDGNLLDRVNTKGDTKAVLYTFEVAPVDTDLLVDGERLPVQAGDVLYHLDDNFSLGEVVSVSDKKPYVVMNEQKTEEVESLTHVLFELQVEAQAVVDDGVYYVNDHDVRVGNRFSFSTPYFTGTCICVAVEEVTDGE